MALFIKKNNTLIPVREFVITEENSQKKLSSTIMFLAPYKITTTISNGTNSGDNIIYRNSTAIINVSANNDYKLPTSITVTNANYSYSRTSDTQGVITLSNPRGNITITANCVASYSSLVATIKEYAYSALSSNDYLNLWYSLDNGTTWKSLSSLEPSYGGTDRTRTVTITHNKHTVKFKSEGRDVGNWCGVRIKTPDNTTIYSSTFTSTAGTSTSSELDLSIYQTLNITCNVS